MGETGRGETKDGEGHEGEKGVQGEQGKADLREGKSEMGRKKKGRKGWEANANAINHISSQHWKATVPCYGDTAHPGALLGTNSAPSTAPAPL